MVGYLDELDRAGCRPTAGCSPHWAPRCWSCPATARPARSPYLVTPEHTAQAREVLGEEPLLAPEFKVVLESDPARARETARAYLAPYLALPNYTDNFLRLGFTESDVADGGSDHLIDAVFAWGDETRIRERIAAFHEAGADHVALQVVTANPGDTPPRKEWRTLASLLA